MIMLISDVHCHYHVINEQINHAINDLKHDVSQVVVLGDLGFMEPCLNDFFKRDGQRFVRPVSFVEGNHEDFAGLAELSDQYAGYLTHLRRTSLQMLGLWRTLCLGGAKYMDAHSTPLGCEIRQRDIEACLEHDPKQVDLVVSHDCPLGIGVPGAEGFEHYGSPGIPGSDQVADHLKPQFWFFGHHHRWFQGARNGTRYYGLPMSWCGFYLLEDNGTVHKVENTVPLTKRPWWTKLFGMR